MTDNGNLPTAWRQADGLGQVDDYWQAAEPEQGQASIERMKRIIRVVWRFKWLVAALTVVGTVAGWFGMSYVDPIYEAEASVWVDVPRRDEVIRGPIQASGLLPNPAWVELLKSFRVLEPVVRQQQLYLDFHRRDSDVMQGFAADPDILPPGEYRLKLDPERGMMTLHGDDGTVLQTARFGEAIGESIGLDWRPSVSELKEPRSVRFTLMSPGQAASILRDDLVAQPTRDGNFLRITYRDKDPTKAADVVNAVTKQYVALATEMKSLKGTEVHGILAKQLASAEEKMLAAELELEAFRVNTITLPSEAAAPMAAGLEATRAPVLDAYFKMKIDRESAQRDRDEIQRAIAASDGISLDALSAIAAVQRSPEMTTTLAELATKRAALRTLAQDFTEIHPDVQHAATAVALLEQQVVPQQAARLAAELGQRMQVLDRLVNSASVELQEIPSRSIEEARRERSVTVAEDLYVDLRQRYETARLANETAVPDLRVHDPASRPSWPASNPRKLVFAVSALGSAAIGVAVAILLGMLDGRVRYAEQVTAGLGLAVIGALPTVAAPRRLGNGNRTWRRSRGADATSAHLGADNPEILEALRAVRMNIMTAFGSAGPIMVTITSPGPGDGKSFTTANLALAFADLGMRTLVIDGDTRRGCLHRIFEADRRPGLTDYLADRAADEEVLRPTRFALVDVLPAGSRVSNSPELLSSSRMGDLLPRIRSSYDVILIDSPPLGAGVDPLVLATLTGNLLLVVRNGNTERAAVEANLRKVERLPVRVLGTVLNGFDSADAYYYYSYTAGYEAGDEELATPVKYLQPA